MSEVKKVKRYSLAQMSGVETRIIKGEDYLRTLLGKIEKYNNNPKMPFFLGDVVVKERENIVTFKKYAKITEPATLEEIDRMTTRIRNDHDLRELYGVSLINNHNLLIAYRANKQIKFLPIIYKKDEKYLNSSYIKSLLIKHGRSISFIDEILESYNIKSHSRLSLDDLEMLYPLRESIKNNYPINVDLTPLIRFYTSFISETKTRKLNYFNLRLMGLLLRNYERETTLEEESREEIIGQTMIRDYVNQILRDLYEELKLSITEGSLEETYKKILINEHKTTK